MTVPRERTSAVQRVREFLYELLHKGKPKDKAAEFHTKVRYLLKHYPGDHDLEESSRVLPDVWGPAYKEEKPEKKSKPKRNTKGK